MRTAETQWDFLLVVASVDFCWLSSTIMILRMKAIDWQSITARISQISIYRTVLPNSSYTRYANPAKVSRLVSVFLHVQSFLHAVKLI